MCAQNDTPREIFKEKYIINPNSGTKKQRKILKNFLSEVSADVIETKSRGDAADVACNLCKEDPYTKIIVVGGDGTLSEAANGIMRAGAGKTAILTGIPLGDGNDFIRGMSEHSADIPTLIDIASINGIYSLNMINIGFDCDVVVATDKIQKSPLFNGSFSYLLGIASTLVKKKSFPASVIIDGSECIDGEFLLIAIGNSPYCGGGIKAIPTASPFDSKFDVIIVDNVTRMQFVTMFGDYKNGSHFENDKLRGRYKKILQYRRCSSVEISGITRFCVDGEIVDCAGVRVDSVPRAMLWQNFNHPVINDLLLS